MGSRSIPIEEGRDDESMSISNQKAMLKDYAEKNGMREYAFYVAVDRTRGIILTSISEMGK